jgi:hypothetical protein
MSTATTDRAAQLRADIKACHALIAYHSVGGTPWVADNWRARLQECIAELAEVER